MISKHRETSAHTFVFLVELVHFQVLTLSASSNTTGFSRLLYDCYCHHQLQNSCLEKEPQQISSVPHFPES